MHKSLIQKGFTIIELMITVAILGILLAIAAPNMSEYLDNQALRASGQRMTSFLQAVRGQAISEVRTFRVCWNSGNANITRNGVQILPGTAVAIDRTDDLNVLVREIEYRDDRLTHADNRGNNCFQYEPSGRANRNVNFVFCKSDTDSRFSRGISLTTQGRVLLADNDQGQLIDCNQSS